MRTLLVDNYDSFTYNLFHHVTEATGSEPVVVRNDDPAWRTGMLSGFDGVIISPGPGNPGRQGDFGICREIVERAELPLLGICLGHQGIGLAHGARVGRAREPRHGRISPVLHDGEELFRGLPSPLQVVRYHSLAVTDLPAELAATAWTPDGVLMGLRHRTRPMWGVQFHPESICTEYGLQLIRNFAELTRERGSRRLASAVAGPVATASSPTAPDAPAPRRLRVLTRQVPTRWGEEETYDRLFRPNTHAFWLDSSSYDPDRGRFSVMGDASGPLARVATADVWSGTVAVTSRTGTEVAGGPFLDWLDQDLRGMHVQLPDLPGDFALGWVGYLGYELKAECGGEAVHRSPQPDAVMVFADRALVLDQLTGLTHLLALVDEDGPAEQTASTVDWLAATEALLGGAPGPPLAAPATPAAARDLQLRHARDTYLDLIDACQEELAAGETYEVCLTNRAQVRGAFDPWEGYRLLRRTDPTPFGALLQFDGVSVLSTSPERFLTVSGSGLIESKPIKGTRPRGENADQDAALVAELLGSEKDRAENLMIVDLVRNDIGRCAQPGSVRVTGLFEVETYATVHQLVSTVQGQIAPGRSAVECVRAAFPAGSMTGAPKVRTMRILDGLEGGARGVYSGALGYFSLSGAADLSVVIRTAVVTSDLVTYGVGGAIVTLSDPGEEFEETMVKAAPLRTLTGAARTAPVHSRRAGS
ncbi:aminodeoxychorismate synthase component I [Streptomyces durmitorensis]|uniref:aminodeoxychorismate synthase n=1 Tax=Streptomyces durmitorensis TaxID=319947 RepID=A0ABY4PPC3_9ACTN|nr:aminodeoxychorismate synthase component I [Streptomyces durmitorensis]UQT54793.1 aminodeoxychorismate synthase component I [Streptomyces durmitorensis]